MQPLRAGDGGRGPGRGGVDRPGRRPGGGPAARDAMAAALVGLSFDTRVVAGGWQTVGRSGERPAGRGK